MAHPSRTKAITFENINTNENKQNNKLKGSGTCVINRFTAVRNYIGLSTSV